MKNSSIFAPCSSLFGVTALLRSAKTALHFPVSLFQTMDLKVVFNPFSMGLPSAISNFFDPSLQILNFLMAEAPILKISRVLTSCLGPITPSVQKRPLCVLLRYTNSSRLSHFSFCRSTVHSDNQVKAPTQRSGQAKQHRLA